MGNDKQRDGNEAGVRFIYAQVNYDRFSGDQIEKIYTPTDTSPFFQIDFKDGKQLVTTGNVEVMFIKEELNGKTTDNDL